MLQRGDRPPSRDGREYRPRASGPRNQEMRGLPARKGRAAMKMSGSIDSHRVRRDDVESAAAAWVPRRNGGPLDASEAAALDTWLAADTRHAQALAEMEEAWTMLNTP